MAVARMKLVNIVGRLRDFDRVVQSCCIKGDFHPEKTSQAVENIKEFAPLEEVNPYEGALKKAVDIAIHSGVTLRYSNFEHLNMTLEEQNAYLDRLEMEFNSLSEKVSGYAQTAARLEQLLTQFKHLENFNISLDDIFGCKQIVFRFGRLPKESLLKLEAEDSDDFLFFPLESDNLFYWGFYVMQASKSQEVDQLFTLLYFERINVIEEAHGKPQEAKLEIGRQLKETRRLLDDAKAELNMFWSKRNCDIFLKVYSSIRYLHDSFDLRKYASKLEDNFYIVGWVDEKDVGAFAKRFERFPNVDCIIESTEEAEDIEPPSRLVNGPAVRPFENFVGMYGLPSYNEIDPTPFMAVTYAVIFGIMFGDLGQGLIILLIALYMKLKKKMFLGDIMIRCSFFSMLFGVLYNSFFGFEDLLPIPTLLPVHENAYLNTVLLVTVGLGAFLILLCMGVNVANGIRQKSIGKILFHQNGLAGMILYISILAGGIMMVMFNKNVMTPFYICILLVLPLLMIAFKEPLAALCERKKNWLPKNKGEFLILSFFDLFDVLLSFFTNTISFIRVGAFILSHSAMMIAVFTLAKMTGAASPLVIVFGNCFVIALEGLVVGIQGLRLQFYEMFSRFYEGTGKPYEPFKIKYDM